MSLGALAMYVGPDQVMTVTSGLAAVVGVLLMFWNKVVGIVLRIFHISRRTPKSDAAAVAAEPPAKNS